MKEKDWADVGQLIVIVMIIVALMFAFLGGVGLLAEGSARNACNQLALTSKYTVKFEGKVWDTSHCWIELTPGVWADSKYIRFDTVQ